MKNLDRNEWIDLLFFVIVIILLIFIVLSVDDLEDIFSGLSKSIQAL